MAGVSRTLLSWWPRRAAQLPPSWGMAASRRALIADRKAGATCRGSPGCTWPAATGGRSLPGCPRRQIPDRPPHVRSLGVDAPAGPQRGQVADRERPPDCYDDGTLASLRQPEITEEMGARRHRVAKPRQPPGQAPQVPRESAHDQLARILDQDNVRPQQRGVLADLLDQAVAPIVAQVIARHGAREASAGRAGREHRGRLAGQAKRLADLRGIAARKVRGHRLDADAGRVAGVAAQRARTGARLAELGVDGADN